MTKACIQYTLLYTKMIANIASFATILCAALLATCGPAATHARTTTMLLRGGLDASRLPAHTISSTAISTVDASDAYNLIDGEKQLRDPTCHGKKRVFRCVGFDLPALLPSYPLCA